MHRSSTFELAAMLMASALAGSIAGCSGGTDESRVSATPPATSTSAATAPNDCDEDNGSISLPSGFCATVFADNIGHARHLAVAPNGDVYVNTWIHKDMSGNIPTNPPGGFIVALRDADHDGHAETTERFGATFQPGQEGGGTGIAIYNGALYAEIAGTIVRYAMSGDLSPKSQPETVLSGLPLKDGHTMHPFVIAKDGALFVNSGSATNSCQAKDRTLESPGLKPCPELATRAGIWRYDANQTGQTFSAAGRHATSLRNTVALAIDSRDGGLYAVIHGRDQLGDNWPKLYTETQNAELPAEVLARVEPGDDFGWPYCYFDGTQNKYVLSPEYGGDGGKAIGECANRKQPDVTFPAHWAPEAMAFYSGSAFPEKYRGGAFVSFHGSWNRTPTQSGFLVAFVPFRDGRPAGTYEEFATGFAGTNLPPDPKQAAYRPMGVAVAPDGSVFVTDDTKGRVWRITHVK
jgi:glucose/arabinose dehydrogenase